MTFYLILIVAGLLIACAGNLWLIIAAFRESVTWGLCVLFLPFAVLVFLFRHWDAAKQPFLCSVLGVLLVAAPVAINWDTLSKQKEFAAALARIKAQATPASASAPEPEQKPETPFMKQARLEKMQTAFAQHAAELKTKYDILQAQWAKLSPKDKTGRAAFDQQATIYQAMRKQVETEKGEVEALAATTK